MKTAILIVGACALLAGCATTYPAVDIGGGRYQTTATAESGLGGSAKAAHDATAAAARKCSALGKSLYVLNTELASHYPNDNAVVTFECH